MSAPPEQLRLTHALVVALAKPADIDPMLVERLVALLPPLVLSPKGPAFLEVRFVGGSDSNFDERLRELLSECQPHLAADATIAALGSRISELEAERDGLKKVVADLQAERARVEPMPDSRFDIARMGDAPQGNGGHANVVPLRERQWPGQRDERHSLAVSTPLDLRYPRGLDPVS
jgi:hypothetical protein